VDVHIADFIRHTRAIDNHAHPVRVTAGDERDTEYDALPVDAMQPYSSVPVRLDAGNPEYAAAWRPLFGVRATSVNGAPARHALDAKAAAKRERGDRYATWVLDQLGIEVMFANRVSMGRGLDPQRFKWVPFADPLMYPLNNDNLGRRDPDRKTFFTAEQKLLDRYRAEAGAAVLPRDFDGYLRLASDTLERWKRSGAVAVKFEMAYLRSLAVGNPDRATAAAVFTKYASGGTPPDAGYKDFQDYTFRYIASECGRLGLAVHIHACAGAGSYFDVAGANPVGLESVLNDPALRKTNFVLIHGGWPYTAEATALLTKPNVYLDYSAETYLLYPRALARVLRGYLEYQPGKVLFATDASPMSPQVSWEESGWVSANTARDALAIALTYMVRDREITHDRALQIARMVLHENARKLYGL
jgi:predicted TIM-barrel fold metal-dependent hydrolase